MRTISSFPAEVVLLCRENPLRFIMPEGDLPGASQAGYAPWKRTFWGVWVTPPRTVFYPVALYCGMLNNSLAIIIRIKRKAHAFFVHNLPSPSPPFLVKWNLRWKLPFLSKSIPASGCNSSFQQEGIKPGSPAFTWVFPLCNLGVHRCCYPAVKGRAQVLLSYPNGGQEMVLDSGSWAGRGQEKTGILFLRAGFKIHPCPHYFLIG